MNNATERRSVSRRTEDIYRKAIEDIRDYAIFMTDPDGVITTWNIGAQHIWVIPKRKSSARMPASFSLRRTERKMFPAKSWRLPQTEVARKTSAGMCGATDRVSGPAASSHQFAITQVS